jgi:hypothetical protein
MVTNAKCQDCRQPMSGSTSCTWKYIKINGKIYKRDTTFYDYGRTIINGKKCCHDCGIVNHGGHVHHFGCDIERCPRCHGQLIACNCTGRIPHKSATMSAHTSVKTKVAKNPYAIGIGGW